MKLEGDYEKVVIDTRQAQPYIFYLFYGKYDPARYHNELNLNEIGVPRKSFNFGKFEFRNIDWKTDKYRNKTLFIGNNITTPKELDFQVDYRKDILLNDGFTENVIVGIK
jgi:hypothetical protein